MTFLTALLLASTLGASPGAPSPACKPATPGDVDAPSSFGAAVVELLGQVRIAIDRMPDDGPRDAAEVTAILEAIGREIGCACKGITPFTKSHAASIRDAARKLGATCDALPPGTSAMASALRAQASGKQGADARMAKAIEEKDRSWGQFLVAAAGSVGVLVELRDDQPTGKLLVTRVERKELLARIEKRFGKAALGAPEEQQDPPTMVAAGWYRILSDSGYRGSDEPEPAGKP